ncbi:expressed unknown protein [Seminavis robusta]|uniref:Uncharacterized protein n=1 Tax=Seminavis robusta TaxID=568900 RepID=A0A9N8DVG9_9STRA|nr:expressed unknown protein [Seminavis robusta]|eukprot:Sro402_g135460.1 n/a (238) ;mRNA; r:41333-42046
MGSKKKSKGKQRKNLKAKSHESHGGLGCFEGEEEGLKRLLEDIHETKEIDCHMVAKCLPKTLRNMREKKIEVHSLSIQLVCEYKNAYILPNITSSELEDKTNDHLCQSLAEKAFEFVPGYRELLSKDDIQQFSKYLLFLLSNEAVCEHLAKAGGNPYFDGSDSDNKADDDLAFLTNPIRTVLSSRAIDWPNFEMDKLKTAVDATCRSWAPRMDSKLCNGETAPFSANVQSMSGECQN